MSHLTEDALFQYHLSSGPRDVDVQSHVTECHSCQGKLEELQSFVGVLREPEAWGNGQKSHSLLAENPVIESLEQIEVDLADERAAAEIVIALTPPGELERAITTSDPTAGLVHALVDRSYTEVERTPAEGERFARLAVFASSRLMSEDYPAVVIDTARGQAWRQLANALRVRGSFDEALHALDESRVAFEKTPVPDPEIASLDYIRASICFTTGELDVARSLLEDACPTFNRFGDLHRYRNGQLLLAGVIERAGDTGNAVAIMQDLLKATSSDEPVFRGRVLLNLGVYLLRDDPPRAESYLQQSWRHLSSAGYRSSALRARWNLGRCAWYQGRHDQASEFLASVYEEAAALGLDVEVAMIALDRAEIHLENGEYEAVRDLCADALRTFRRVGARRFAAEAFSYLEISAKSESLTTEDLRFVRKFFTSVTEGEVAFSPPN